MEKSRIVHQNQDERNYHIFYCMLAGLSKEHKSKLELKDATHYKYLTGGGSVVCDGRDDAAEFADIRYDIFSWNLLAFLIYYYHAPFLA